jgi:tRNA-specific 2-thiouridylase
MKKKAIVLTSGGLDSLLALAILEQAGIEPVGVHFVTWFNTPKYTLPDDLHGLVRREKGITIRYIDISEDHRRVLLNPVFGYGSAVNPCLDCKILFLEKAKEIMDAEGAYFVATGEVLGQRPMTQMKNSLQLVENRSGLSGYLLRPLSARLLKPTVPEQLGWVDRNSLFGISGRGRRAQIELAKQLGIDAYPAPAGGCILTEKQFQVRFEDLLRHSQDVSVTDLTLLRYGRHFRISPACKLVLGRDEKENGFLQRLRWGNMSLDPASTPGPFALLSCPASGSEFDAAVRITARYCDYAEVPVTIRFSVRQREKERLLTYRGIPPIPLCDRTILK